MLHNLITHFIRIRRLKHYFQKRDDVALAFLFGSRADGRARAISDWDIAVYFRSEQGIEIETSKEYPGEESIRRDIARLLSQEIDLLVLNRARPPLVFTIINRGRPLVIRDERLRLELLVRTHYEAVDFWQFIKEFWEVRVKAASLTPEARAMLIEHLTFLENEFLDFPKFKKMTWDEYMGDRDKRRSIERWIENLVMSALDIAKIMLASKKKDAPQTYRETLRAFAAIYFDQPFAEQFADTADLRNIIAHEYLDIRWDKIQRFIRSAEALYSRCIEKTKMIIGGIS